MFGSFGCCDNFRECHHHERERDHREKEVVRPQKPAVCNVLANISIGTEISLLKLKGNGTFRHLIFEGFCNGIALFSALNRYNKDDKDNNNNKDDKDGRNRNDDRFEGILRVCPEDIIAIAL